MRRIDRIVILTGAGISAESGLGTFRDEGGLWAQHRIEDVATPEAFMRDPALVHRFYNARRIQAADAQPNAAHQALARLQ
jgi:NAD-dependent deacetylase